MRFLRILGVSLLAAAAVIGGLIVAAFVAIAAAVLLALRRLLGGSRPKVEGGPAMSRSRPGDAIDVTVTEVPADRLPR